MDIRHLEYFVTVVDEGSINGAADILHLGQPALSRQVQALERELGIELLLRSSKGVTPTGAGIALARHARRILSLHAETREVVSQHRAVEEMINLGVPPGTPQKWLFNLIQLLMDELSCQPQIAEISSTQQLKRLREGRLDLALVHQEPPRDLNSHLLRSEEFGLAIRPGTVFEAKEYIGVAELHGSRIMVHSREQVPTQQDALIAAVLAAGAEPVWQFVQFVEHAAAAAEACRADAVLISRHTAQRQFSEWVWRPIKGLHVQMRTWLLFPKQSRHIVQEAANLILYNEKALKRKTVDK